MENIVDSSNDEKCIGTQAEAPIEKEIDLNLLFPGEDADLNNLFPDNETKSLLKKALKNRIDIRAEILCQNPSAGYL